MNILDKLPFLNSDPKTEADQAALEAEAKAERIKFHRTQVRNGPVKFKAPTTGQIKRAQRRALAAEGRKGRRRQVRAYIRQQQEAATIRGHLQGAGVVAYAGDTFTTTPERALQSIVWIVQRFAEGDENGVVEVTEENVRLALTRALNRWQAIVGHPQTKLSPAYVLPVALSA